MRANAFDVAGRGAKTYPVQDMNDRAIVRLLRDG